MGWSKHRYVIEARGSIAERYALAEYGTANRIYHEVCRSRRVQVTGSPFKTREQALRCGLVRVIELGARSAATDPYFGAVFMIDRRTGREELVR